MNYATVLHKNMIVLFFLLHQNKIINIDESHQNKFLSKYHTQPRLARKYIKHSTSNIKQNTLRVAHSIARRACNLTGMVR